MTVAWKNSKTSQRKNYLMLSKLTHSLLMSTKPLTSPLIVEKMPWRPRLSSQNWLKIFTQPKIVFLPSKPKMLLCSLRRTLKWMNKSSNKCFLMHRSSKCSKIIVKPWQSTSLTENCWVLLQSSSVISSKKSHSFLIAHISFSSTMMKFWAAGLTLILHQHSSRLRIDPTATINSSSMKLSSQRSSLLLTITEP